MAILVENYLDFLNKDLRAAAHEWQGPNIPYGDDSNRPNLIRQCTMLEGAKLKINCLRKLRDQAAMNPFYQHRIDRYIDEITDTYEPTENPGTIPGNEFEETGVGEDAPISEAYISEGLKDKLLCKRAKVGIKMNKDNYLNPAKEGLKNCIQYKKTNPAKYQGCVNYYTKVIKTTEKAITSLEASAKKHCGK